MPDLDPFSEFQIETANTSTRRTKRVQKPLMQTYKPTSKDTAQFMIGQPSKEPEDSSAKEVDDNTLHVQIEDDDIRTTYFSATSVSRSLQSIGDV